MCRLIGLWVFYLLIGAVPYIPVGIWLYVAARTSPTVALTLTPLLVLFFFGLERSLLFTAVGIVLLWLRRRRHVPRVWHKVNLYLPLYSVLAVPRLLYAGMAVAALGLVVLYLDRVFCPPDVTYPLPLWVRGGAIVVAVAVLLYSLLRAYLLLPLSLRYYERAYARRTLVLTGFTFLLCVALGVVLNQLVHGLLFGGITSQMLLSGWLARTSLQVPRLKQVRSLEQQLVSPMVRFEEPISDLVEHSGALIVLLQYSRIAIIDPKTGVPAKVFDLSKEAPCSELVVVGNRILVRGQTSLFELEQQNDDWVLNRIDFWEYRCNRLCIRTLSIVPEERGRVLMGTPLSVQEYDLNKRRVVTVYDGMLVETLGGTTRFFLPLGEAYSPHSPVGELVLGLFLNAARTAEWVWRPESCVTAGKRYIVAWSPGSLTLYTWGRRGGRRVAYRFFPHPVVEISLMGEWVVCGTLSRWVYVVRASDLQVVKQVKLDGLCVYGPVVVGSGVLVQSSRGTIYLIDRELRVWRIKHDTLLTAYAITPAGVVVGDLRGCVLLLRDNQLQPITQLPATPTALLYHNNTLLVGTHQGTLYQLSLPTPDYQPDK